MQDPAAHKLFEDPSSRPIDSEGSSRPVVDGAFVIGAVAQPGERDILYAKKMASDELEVNWRL